MTPHQLITGWWYASNPKKHDCMEFNMKYPQPLKEEVFKIFMQTGYKNQTPEMNGEILERLNRALYLRNF